MPPPLEPDGVSYAMTCVEPYLRRLPVAATSNWPLKRNHLRLVLSACRAPALLLVQKRRMAGISFKSLVKNGARRVLALQCTGEADKH